MIIIHIIRSGLQYWIDEISFPDPGGLYIYLRAKGVTPVNLLKVAEGLGRHGAYTIDQE